MCAEWRALGDLSGGRPNRRNGHRRDSDCAEASLRHRGAAAAEGRGMGEEKVAAEAAGNDDAIAWSARGNPAQLALLECPIFEVFFGGARGGGKTDGMLGEWVRHADLYGEHAIGLMLRRTRTELIETIERSRAIY